MRGGRKDVNNIFFVKMHKYTFTFDLHNIIKENLKQSDTALAFIYKKKRVRNTFTSKIFSAVALINTTA